MIAVRFRIARRFALSRQAVRPLAVRFLARSTFFRNLQRFAGWSATVHALLLNLWILRENLGEAATA